MAIELAASVARRRASLLRALALCMLLVVPLRVVAEGWLPKDDVRRHVAKAISGKPWTDIVLLRADARLDEHPGWHAVLGAVHRAGVESPRALADFAIVSLAALFLVAPLFCFAFPEAWLAALAAVALLEPGFFPRVLMGRPFVAAMALLALLLACWEKLRGERPPWLAWGALGAGFALVVWMHSSWYLWLLPLAAFVAAREWRVAMRIGAAWIAGTLVGAALTGSPRGYLAQAIAHLFWSFGSNERTRMLATEFQPGGAAAVTLLAAALLLLWRRRPRAAWDDPAFLVAAASAVLGLFVARFWTDWGIPALLVWSARELEGAWMAHAADLRRRAGALAVAAAVLIAAVVTNRNDRWSDLSGERHLRLEDPALAGWLPDPGGILYSNSMALFYDTFFENPRAEFRYAVGFEPGLMPPADLAVFRDVQRRNGADEAFLPWVSKLQPADRLVVARQSGNAPQIPTLEWRSPFAGVWIGRTWRGGVAPVQPK